MQRNAISRRRTWVGAVLALALAASLVVTVQTAAAGVQRSTVTTLRLLTASGHDNVWHAWIANFERANPTINVSIQSITVGSYPQTLLTQLQAGNGPDLIYAQGGSGQVHSVLSLGEGGRLVDLSKQPWVKRVPAAARPLFQTGGKFYALPLALVPTGVVYNVPLFAQFGLKIPTTFNQLLGLCTTLKAKGKTPFIFAGATFNAGDLGQMIASNAVYASNPNWNADRAKGKTTFAGTAGWHTTLQEVVDMKNTGCFPPDAPGLTLPATFAAMGTGQAVMWSGPSVALGGIHGFAPNLTLGVFPFPGTTVANTRAEVGYTDSLGVNAASPNKAAAIKFINFIAREGQSRIYTTLGSSLSLHDSNVGTVPTNVKAFGPFLKAKKFVLYPNSSWPNAAVYTALGNSVTGLLTGQVTINSALAQMDAAWNKGA